MFNIFGNSESNSTDYIAAIGPLTEKEFKDLVRQGLINRDTRVRREADKTWIRAGEVSAISKYFPPKLSNRTSIFDLIKSFFNEIENWLNSRYKEKVNIPEILYQTLHDYLNKGTDEVALTIGKINGKPAFIVLLVPENQDPEIVAEVEIDTGHWRQENIRAWPETGSQDAKVWKVTR